MAADVSVEALEKVKESAKEFEENVAKISADIIEQNEAALDECRNAIKETEQDLEEVIRKIHELEQQISEKASQIAIAESEIADLRNQIVEYSNRLSGVESRITMLENQKSQLQSQLSRVEDDDARHHIQQQISQIQSEISRARMEAADLRRKISDAKQRINELQAEVTRLKAEKAKLEQERDVELVRKEKIENKLERMKRAFSSLNADMNDYTASVKKFEKKSTDKVGSNVTAIDKCIVAIESYLGVNIASASASSSVGSSGTGTSSTASQHNGLNNDGGLNGVVGAGSSPSELARSFQGHGLYPGVDVYEDVVVRKGTVLYRGYPNGTEYFTTSEAILKSEGKAETLFRGLQVIKHPILGYRKKMQGFVFNQDVAAAFGIATNNTDYGEGGLPQFFIPNIEELLASEILTPSHLLVLAR